MSSILLYIGIKEHNVNFSFCLHRMSPSPFHLPKMLIHLAPFISLDAQSMYI